MKDKKNKMTLIFKSRIIHITLAEKVRKIHVIHIPPGKKLPLVFLSSKTVQII